MKRIHSIDFTRGLVMVIMALDHVRDLMHVTSLNQAPTNLQTTTTGLFMTRWITHLCAPTFVFLSGVSAYISFSRLGNRTASRNFLFNRGLWLVILEFTVVNFALWMDIHFRTLIMEVICAIGVGFIVLSFLLKLRARSIGIIGLVIIFGHNLLQGISFPANPVLNTIASVLFAPNMLRVPPEFTFLVGYPLVPWLGILLLGFACGKLFDLPLARRKKIFRQLGIASLLFF
ncbi:MAG TPA: heparan-alpha-glucosaminide N-acetyltransferase domain-containing protein, partial [Puia sp.]|nr:heparan-alpha-glucosaminide N-acetyltransferase domain-containing protein [Puia sp.]